MLHRFHEPLGHAVALGRTYRRGQRFQTEFTREAPRAMVRVRRAIVAQPLDRRSRARRPGALLNSRKHDVAHDVTAMAAGRRRPADRLPIAAVQCERDADRLAVVAPELEAIGTPAQVARLDRNTAVVPPSVSLATAALKQQLVLAHHPIDSFGVHPIGSALLATPAHDARLANRPADYAVLRMPSATRRGLCRPSSSVVPQQQGRARNQVFCSHPFDRFLQDLLLDGLLSE
ncbi:hypothetical protein BLA50215_00007 [Burkholderia lata]|nr:hypothetical protein BLA50215_00007 [Burkholderia lata]